MYRYETLRITKIRQIIKSQSLWFICGRYSS